MKLRQAFVIDANEVREILAEKFGVPVENVIKAKYSYTVIKNDEVKIPENAEEKE